MSQTVSVHLLPKLFEPDELRGGVAVVIDVLRASTTIVHALAAGAKTVIPCEEVDEARKLAANHSDGECLLGGERDGLRIEGFDLDNSPLAYTEEIVGGRTIVFTTTNGTRALARAKQAETVLIGAFVNMQAIINDIVIRRQPVHLVCAGTNGAMTCEDVLFAGAVASDLLDRGYLTSTDETRIASRLYCSQQDSSESLFDALCDSVGGRNLCAAGFEADIRRAAEPNLFHIVPQYNPKTNTITTTV